MFSFDSNALFFSGESRVEETYRPKENAGQYTDRRMPVSRQLKWCVVFSESSWLIFRCRSFMSLADYGDDCMTGANQRQESGFKDSKLSRSACQNRDEKNWLGPAQDYQKSSEMRGRRGNQGPGQECGNGQLRSQYGGVPAECNMNEASQWTEITKAPQCNRNRKNSKQQSYPKESAKWEESQCQDDDNSEWVEWPENMKRYHADGCHAVQKRC